MEKFNVRGEKLTTQQRKPHFIKLENNIGGNPPPKKSWERLSASGYRERTGGLCTHALCVWVHMPLSVLPHIPLTASSGLPPAFLSPFCSLFFLWPWAVTRHLRWRKFSISNHRSVPQKLQFWLLRSRFCLHSPEQPGALGQSQNLKENVKPLELLFY